MTLATQSSTIPATEPRSARPWFTGLLAVLATAPVAYFFIDRPLATLSYENLRPYRKIFDAMTRIIDPFAAIAGLVFLVAIISVARGREIGPLLAKLLRVSAGLCATIIVKDQLKFAFGRTWPETWIMNNPSYFKDGAFGFNPFHGGPGWASFPSGHTTVVCALAASLWVLFPRGRPFYALAVALVVVGLIGADYHWLSDIIAGAGLGTAMGVTAARVGARS
jgi:membrane-associated phospholipid phosphatase